MFNWTQKQSVATNCVDLSEKRRASSFLNATNMTSVCQILSVIQLNTCCHITVAYICLVWNNLSECLQRRRRRTHHPHNTDTIQRLEVCLRRVRTYTNSKVYMYRMSRQPSDVKFEHFRLQIGWCTHGTANTTTGLDADNKCVAFLQRGSHAEPATSWKRQLNKPNSTRIAILLFNKWIVFQFSPCDQ